MLKTVDFIIRYIALNLPYKLYKSEVDNLINSGQYYKLNYGVTRFSDLET